MRRDRLKKLNRDKARQDLELGGLKVREGDQG